MKEKKTENWLDEGPVKGGGGENTIEFRIKFFSDDIADKKGYIMPKQVWENGVVILQPNDTHGIKRPKNPMPFNSLAYLVPKLLKLARENGVKFHQSATAGHYKRGFLPANTRRRIAAAERRKSKLPPLK